MHQSDPLGDGYELLVCAPRRIAGRVQVVLLAVTVVLATIVAVHERARSRPAVRITMSGLAVADPATVLQKAQRRFERYVSAGRGGVDQSSECWFQRPAGFADVIDSLLCGPVQFYADGTDAPYLPFRLGATESNPVHLRIAAGPATATPVGAPAGTTLLRPGRVAVPLIMTNVLAPAPRPAEVNALAMTNAVYPPDLRDASKAAQIGNNKITVKLLAAAPVLTYGRGAAARSAAPGMQLYAFRLAFRDRRHGSAHSSLLQLGVAVGAAAPRQLQLHLGFDHASRLFVVAASSTTPLALVITECGVVERLPLRTGSARGTTRFTPTPGSPPEVSRVKNKERTCD